MILNIVLPYKIFYFELFINNLTLFKNWLGDIGYPGLPGLPGTKGDKGI